MAEIARGAGRHEWACFAAQQGAEKGVKARHLDSLYIPTRYPDAFPEGPSAEHYGPLQSQEALDHTLAEWRGLEERSPRFARVLREATRWLLGPEVVVAPPGHGEAP